jgi:hypothetical protein
MTNTFIPHNITSRSIAMVVNGAPLTIDRSSVSYEQVLKAIKEERWSDVEELANPKVAIKKLSGGRVLITDGSILFDGVEMHSVLADRIVRQAQEGFNVQPMVNFMTNLEENPSMTARSELYLFLESNEIPFTDDGHFLAYKKVTGAYKDCHTGTIDNSVGAEVTMKRFDVDDNRERTCSAGLHFCSYEYLKSFGGERTVIVKINPRDVVAIPSDYNNAKGRTCRYVVTDEIKNESSPAFQSSVYGQSGRLNTGFPPTTVDSFDWDEYLNECFGIFDTEYKYGLLILSVTLLGSQDFLDGDVAFYDEEKYDFARSNSWRWGWLSAWKQAEDSYSEPEGDVAFYYDY